MIALSQPSILAIVTDLAARCGFSCIPLEPDSKRPPHGFDLSTCFTQKPSHSQQRKWFASAANYAVVCGSVSDNLFVLDFDTHDAYHHFCDAFPTLARSYTVQTRRGYHVYLRSHHTHLKSRKIIGGELKASHSYVVGAGSVINGTYYTVTINAPVLTCDQPALNHLLSMLTHSSASTQPHTPAQNVSARERGLGSEANHASTTLDPLRLVQHYKSHVLASGRNNALYRSALLASHSGVSQQIFIDTLAAVHSHTTAISAHNPETIEQRHQEALLTIASAYKKKHKTQQNPTQPHGDQQRLGLPNPLREILLNHAKTTTARLLDAFALAGWQEGKRFSMQDAVKCGERYGMGRSSIMKVVRQRGIFPNASNMPPPVRDSDNSIPNSNAAPRRGKPVTKWYVVPSYEELAKYCGVTLEGCSTDKLSAADLRSNKAYRMALHRAFVKRTSPELSTRFMAERLGVCERSLRRYNAGLAVVRTPIFAYEPLVWANINEEIFWGDIRRSEGGQQVAPGRWLQVQSGKRYPAIRGIALKLLAKGETTIYCRRLPSRLTLPDDDENPASSGKGTIYCAPTGNHHNYHAAAIATNAIDYDTHLLAPTGGGAGTPNCHVIWRHVRGQFPDWCGDEHVLPPPLRQQTVPATVHPTVPDDLTLIKGIGKTWARILRHAGIDSYVKLAAVVNFEGVARLFRTPYLTSRQVSFWVYQASLLASGAVTVAELRTWRYRDWKDYQFELSRVRAGASERLKWKLAEEFIDFDWFKYKPSLPQWFEELMDTVQRSRLF